MNKNLITLTLTYILLFSLASAYEIPTRNDYRYYDKGVYVNMRKRQQEFYKDQHERNKAHKDMYLCLVPKGEDIGYIVHRSSTGALGYVYDTDYYMLMEKRRCSAKYDTYPVVNSWTEAQNFQY